MDHPCVKTPHLDALIADSVYFCNHYTVCAPCGPARASLLAGMYLQNYRSCLNGTPLDARHINIALEAQVGSMIQYCLATLIPAATQERRPKKN